MNANRRRALKRIAGTATALAGAAFLNVAQSANGPVLTVETFRREDAGPDWMAAFQRASNELHKRGGGILRLSQPYYYLGQYRGSDVDGKILSTPLANDVVSAVWVIPSNVTVVGECAVQLDLGGGPSSPLGFKGTFNVLTAPLERENSTNVITVNFSASTVRVDAAAHLNVGQTVRIARQGQPPGGTPSREDAPNQFLTIRLIAGNDVAFFEPFAHRFDTVQDLVLRSPAGVLDYPRNIFLENIHFTSRGPLSYVLHSRTINSGWKNVTLGKKVNASWGTSQQVKADGVVIDVDPHAQNALSIESTSDVEWGSLTLDGNGSNSPYGGLLVDDHSRSIHFKKIVARTFTRGGITLVYGVDVVIDELTMTDCATSADPTKGFSAALSVGFPAAGAGPSVSRSLDRRYLVRNSGPTNVRVRKLTIIGPTTVPVRAHDATLTLDRAYIEFANIGGGAPFVVGESGTERADPQYYPRGAQSNVHLGKVAVKTVLGAPSDAYMANARGSMFLQGTGRLNASHLVLDGEPIDLAVDR